MKIKITGNKEREISKDKERELRKKRRKSFTRPGNKMGKKEEKRLSYATRN